MQQAKENPWWRNNQVAFSKCLHYSLIITFFLTAFDFNLDWMKANRDLDSLLVLIYSNRILLCRLQLLLHPFPTLTCTFFSCSSCLYSYDLLAYFSPCSTATPLSTALSLRLHLEKVAFSLSLLNFYHQ